MQIYQNKNLKLHKTNLISGVPVCHVLRNNIQKWSTTTQKETAHAD